MVYHSIFVVLHAINIANPLRHEYLIGVWIGLFYGLGALLLATLTAATVKQHLSRAAFRWLIWPSLFIGSLFLVFVAYSLVVEFASKA